MDSDTTANVESLARVFQALADKRRLEIIGLLTRGERCVCELTNVVGAKQPLLSFHLKILRQAGLVSGRRRGKWMYYSLNYETFDLLRERIASVADVREHSEECCCESVCCPSH
jgi:ArsR family transcriptional regulator